MALSICGFAGGYSRAVFLRPGVALRYTPGCVLAPFQGAGGGDDWMMWGWVWRVGCVFVCARGACGSDDWMMWGWVWRVGCVFLRSGRGWW